MYNMCEFHPYPFLDSLVREMPHLMSWKGDSPSPLTDAYGVISLASLPILEHTTRAYSSTTVAVSQPLKHMSNLLQIVVTYQFPIKCAPISDKIWCVLGPEFGAHAGKCAIVAWSLYGLKSAGSSKYIQAHWWLSKTLRFMWMWHTRVKVCPSMLQDPFCLGMFPNWIHQLSSMIRTHHSTNNKSAYCVGVLT
jgi:hypothetical protein